MRVLITGGAGFIGSHLTDRIMAAGGRVRVLDNLSTGKLENLPKDKNSFEFTHGDIQQVILSCGLPSRPKPCGVI